MIKNHFVDLLISKHQANGCNPLIFLMSILNKWLNVKQGQSPLHICSITETVSWSGVARLKSPGHLTDRGFLQPCRLRLLQNCQFFRIAEHH